MNAGVDVGSIMRTFMILLSFKMYAVLIPASFSTKLVIFGGISSENTGTIK